MEKDTLTTKAMIGYGILLMIPVVGFISALIFLANKNRPERSKYVFALMIVRLVAYIFALFIGYTGMLVALRLLYDSLSTIY